MEVAVQERHALEAELRFLGVPDHEASLASLKAAFTYPFWNLKEGKGVQPDQDGSVRLMVGGVRIRLHSDQFLTQEEYEKQGGSFKSEETPQGSAAQTTWSFARVDWEPKSVVQQDMGQGLFMVADYTDPVVNIAIRTTYRRTPRIRSLRAARSVASGYGLGRTLQEHEAYHVADGINYARTIGPRFPDSRGAEINEFNKSLRAFFAQAANVGAEIGKYSRQRTDCAGKKKAPFCK